MLQKREYDLILKGIKYEKKFISFSQEVCSESENLEQQANLLFFKSGFDACMWSNYWFPSLCGSDTEHVATQHMWRWSTLPVIEWATVFRH